MFETLFPYAYPIELVQLTFAFLGAIANILGVLDSTLDYKYVVLSGQNGARKFVAKKNLEDESMRLLVQGLFILAGILSVKFPPPYPHGMLSAESFDALALMRSVLTLASLILMLKSVKDNWDRMKLRQMLDKKNSH